ncbi:aminotransferase class I/II-fold pyridoxal phosphate-dependent enzyme [Chengkuizengella axinellae]|uniref:Aminotransferase class I/II-fold pyridoxal phosphate-dependent enzyme n=1 Tax=Chengkuizengella axinellae TaxID=3064388 RepID=A0ABT9ITH0_9BACL|nr:aminotransferase class I/II-fold pyridoxal phosphate-dependent enzyme [Chengkuizengella sp. 2205SS18-9]MDP5272633.1 aminotransferase class I/II-fold pyridoxal phosphate-dependent enzyme [Chengkuizengella sp. 2205SS18-9]
MNPLAESLNKKIKEENPNIYEMLSTLGKNIYFPKEGIISQSAEAGKKAKKYNATIGIALENKQPMHLNVIQDTLSEYEPKDIYPYAPPAGKPELRKVWREKMMKESPDLQNKTCSNPIVTNALTHGISIVADLFADAGDPVIYPDKNWENYELTFGIRRGAEQVNFPLYNKERQFNAEGLKEAILSQKDKGKAIVVLNFPNNPTGYTPNAKDSENIVNAILAGAEAGMHIVVVTDDAYYGLFFEDSIQESLFGRLANIHPNVLAIKVDGATKEDYVWGFRVGFITYASESEAVNTALEQKTMGIIRATISSGSHPSQTFVLHALQSADYEQQKQEKYDIMKGRANKVKEILKNEKFQSVWDFYPFNSGYFMCLELKTIDAESLRVHLLDNYEIGTIALGENDLRVAFSCIEEGDLEDLFEKIYQSIQELTKKKITTS